MCSSDLPDQIDAPTLRVVLVSRSFGKMAADDTECMPQVGVSLIDDDAVELIGSWIEGIAGCP